MPLDVPQFQPLPNTGSQIERAVANYFVKCGVGDVTNNHVTNDNTDRDAPCNDILAHQSIEGVMDSRIEVYQTRIQSIFPAIVQPEQADQAWNWKQVNDWIGNVMAAMSQRYDVGDRDFRATADLITQFGRALAVDETNGADPIAVKRAKDNADMVNFTCQRVRFLGSVRAGKGADGGLYFFETRNFEIHAVPCNAD